MNLRVFWLLAGIGFTAMGFGVYGLIDNSHQTHPDQWIRWFVGAAIAHDFVLAPIVALLGVVAIRRIPAPYRGIVHGALIASGIVALTAYPFVRGYGRRPDDPSVLPNNYALGLAAVLAVIWLVAGGMTLRAVRTRVHEKPEDQRA